MPDRDTVAAWLGLISLPGAGAQTARTLAARWGGPQAALAAGEAEWSAAGLGPEQVAWLARHQPGALLRQVQRAGNAGITFLVLGEPAYPALLAATPDPPPLLSILGSLLAADKRAVALVGTRDPSPAGGGLARALAETLAREGITVVSGLARGIDTAAHWGALTGGGRTIAVLGCGLSRCYPPENVLLAEAISHSGCLLSERPPAALPSRQALLARNRLQAGLARALVVVQARQQGGSYVAAKRALRLGRPVFVLLWEEPEFAAGCRRLEAMGARVCLPEMLLEGLHAALDSPLPCPQPELQG